MLLRLYFGCCTVACLSLPFFQFAVDVERVWSNALLYNKDPSHLVYVTYSALPRHGVVECSFHCSQASSCSAW